MTKKDWKIGEMIEHGITSGKTTERHRLGADILEPNALAKVVLRRYVGWH